MAPPPRQYNFEAQTKLTTVLGSILTLEMFSDRFGVNAEREQEYGYDVATRQGIIVGSYDLGCFGGAVATFLVGGCLGRKKTIFVGTVVMMVGALLQTFSGSYATMMPGRYAAPIEHFGGGFFDTNFMQV